MSNKDKDKNKVCNWPELKTRVDSETKQQFQDKLKETGETQSHAMRRMIRNYSKDSDSTK